MNWLPPPQDFRARLAAVNASNDAAQRMDELSKLADSRLSFLETIQIDTALAKTAEVDGEGFEPVRLAVLAASTVNHLLPAIRVAGLRRGLRVNTYASGYNQYRQELLGQAPALHAFRPDVVLFSLVARDFLAATPLDATAEEAERAVAPVVDDLKSLWRRAQDEFGALVIQQSFLDVADPIFGGLDAAIPGTPTRLVARLNAALAEAAFGERVLWLDVARASARDGLNAWFDVVRWLQGKIEIAPEAAPVYGDLVTRLIAAGRGKSKKCLVLDLDNTLWGGVIGDDGLEGIVLGEGSGVGEAHLALQRYAKTLNDRGVILAVCSKNEPSIAEAAFAQHPEMLLKRSDFAAFVANWTDKAENLKAIARTLNIGVDSLVFVDDNPVERAHVRGALPMVAVPELPDDPAHYVRCIAEAGYFEAVSFTEEDRARTRQLVANLERESTRGAAESMDDFLRKLEMTVEFGPVTQLNLARVTQLINKTNQFNTTTIRRTEAEIKCMASDPASLLLQFRLIDKFGDNGIVSVIILRPAEDEPGVLDMVNWVMSCRVFGRQLEDEVMNILVAAARRSGALRVRALFVPTGKNGVIKDLFERLGFVRADQSAGGNGESRWILSVPDYAVRSTTITNKEVAHF